MQYKKLQLISILVILITSLLVSQVHAESRVLQQGMKGNDVRELQESLVMLGEKLIIDGIFGPSTKEAIINFQRDAELPADGIVGATTRKHLKEANSFNKHTVKSGDTLSELASTYDVSVEVIKKANDLNSNVIRIGQELVIPKTALGGGINTDFYEIVSYKVERGDTLERISKKFNTTVGTIKKLNDFQGDSITSGQTIKVSKLTLDLSNTSKNVTKVKPDFVWPTKSGRISSDYGWRVHPILNKKQFHKGIDIALRTGTPIKATKAGKVISSGWISGFGKTITIDHGNGVISLYGHNSRLLVRKGQRVKQGQIIAKSGNTGRSTGPHLEFRIMIDGNHVNPHKYIN
ncbi:peptidoglycan DD-metalloendopeptidase family protein [Selenihalanaerobacter shriftii]|uniref:Murein DD-endopeptidase MepM and murein hydrolase activator NlpD, contain LysM domain n=1 Tax=Selenihalanaerobacter shriftii TaxID=142842 RepID=A0A1T4JMM8_9FIRM|nr:peptidoglycan DD-metalloendopeptidase family protein [Selenihalanaerobacter shriftii]SJZ31391.1 Murein DD-endopeptidase MepM and murein hydrolase activator NlpD, contain LysM domain [Selenihalanaerobacter shriftii]